MRKSKNPAYTKSGLKLLRLDSTSLATQGVDAGAQPNAYTGYGINFYVLFRSNEFNGVLSILVHSDKIDFSYLR